MLTKERIEAIRKNTGSMLDQMWPSELRELCDLALRGIGGEAVGECVKATGSLKDMMIIRWRDGFTPHEGQLLYTAPAAAPENEALAKRLLQAVDDLKPFTGEHDHFNQNLTALLNEAAAALGGGE